MFGPILFAVGVLSSAVMLYLTHGWVESLRAHIAELNLEGPAYGRIIYTEGGHAAKDAGQEVPPCAGKTIEYDLAKEGAASVARELATTRRLLNKASSARLKASFFLVGSLALLAFSLFCV